MESLHAQMRQMKSQYMTDFYSSAENDARLEQETDEMKKKLPSVLAAIGQNLASGDEKLQLKQPADGTEGFTIVMPADDFWRVKEFAVSATCEKATVQLTVTDGQWERMANQLGSWADWTDAKMVYSGKLVESKIAEVLEREFLSWYRFAMHPEKVQ